MKLATMLKETGYNVHNLDDLRAAHSAIQTYAALLDDPQTADQWRQELYDLANDLMCQSALLLHEMRNS